MSRSKLNQTRPGRTVSRLPGCEAVLKASSYDDDDDDIY